MSTVLLMSMRMVAVTMFMKRKIPSMHGLEAMPAISDSESAFDVVQRKNDVT
jgi:hypothetical protein